MKKSKKNNIDDILREFNRTLHEEIGYPSIASRHPFPVTGLGHPEQPQVPDSFQGKLDLHDAVDTLFYHFSPSQILDALGDHLLNSAKGAGEEKGNNAVPMDNTDPQDIQNMLDSVSELKRIADKLR